jgi:hypothetical protein
LHQALHRLRASHVGGNLAKYSFLRGGECEWH